MPSRSATDATRFTSTTPHASAKQSAPNSQHVASKLPARFPGPPGETPQQKVKRLRAAADAARNSQYTTMDKVIIIGRVWADRLHVITTSTLILCTIIAGGVTTYALSDMMIYNRRKKREWFADQQEQFRVALAAAHTALASGTATEQHLDFLQREEEHAISLRAAEEEKKRWSLTQRIKGLLYSGLKMDFGDEWRLGANVPSEKESEGPQENQILKAIEERRSQLRSTATTAFATEKERQRNGGPLDQLGTTGAKNSGSQSEEPKAGGWTSFMIRK